MREVVIQGENKSCLLLLRFNTHGEKLIHFSKLPWKFVKLAMCFRLTHKMKCAFKMQENGCIL